MDTVKVKRKGQVTIPADLRRQHKIKEGDLLSVESKDDRTIILKLRQPLEPGQVVGPEEQRKILLDLKKLRERWR